MFGWDTTGGGLYKQLYQDAGRGGIVPVTDNPIDLVVYPNPLSIRTRFMYTVPVEDAQDMTEVRVFDVTGFDVSRLVRDVKPAGRHAVEFDATELRSGQYIVAVHLKNHMQSKLIVITK